MSLLDPLVKGDLEFAMGHLDTWTVMSKTFLHLLGEGDLECTMGHCKCYEQNSKWMDHDDHNATNGDYLSHNKNVGA